MIALSTLALILQEVVTPETRAAAGMDAFSWTFMLVSMLAVGALTVYCYARILGGKEHFDPDGTGPAHSPVEGKVEHEMHERETHEHEGRGHETRD